MLQVPDEVARYLTCKFPFFQDGTVLESKVFCNDAETDLLALAWTPKRPLRGLPAGQNTSYLSAFQMSPAAFHLPSGCFFQVTMYFSD